MKVKIILNSSITSFNQNFDLNESKINNKILEVIFLYIFFNAILSRNSFFF